MSTAPINRKRFRPRFSIRTLIIVVTLICCYAACWGPTKTRGVRDVEARLGALGILTLPEWAAPFNVCDALDRFDNPFVARLGNRISVVNSVAAPPEKRNHIEHLP